VECDVLFTDAFGEWWDGLSAEEQSSHSHMRELRIQHEGRPFRVLYAFDPKRNAILLIGGDKTGNNRWYEIFIPIADRLYDQHLREIEKE
jgi:hypothetical protein